jgi:hypothetical protein
VVFWVVSQCSDAVRYQRFRGLFCVHLKSDLNMEAAWSFHIITRCHSLNLHRRRNLKTCILRLDYKLK